MNAYDDFRKQFDSDDAAARAVFSELYKQLLDTIGWGNAVALQLHRLRVAVLECDNDKLKTILTEPVTECPGNVVQDTIKDLQQQVRELEIANEGLRAKIKRGPCAFHGWDTGACEKYSGDLPCEPIPGLEQLG